MYAAAHGADAAMSVPDWRGGSMSMWPGSNFRIADSKT